MDIENKRARSLREGVDTLWTFVIAVRAEFHRAVPRKLKSIIY